MNAIICFNMSMTSRLCSILLVALVLVGNVSSFGNPADKLNRADSLYKAKQFSEALRNYEELYATGHTTPAALLRSAYIQEGTGDFNGALVNLYRHYRLTNDEAVYAKVTQMAADQGLSGYESSEQERIRAILKGWAFWINGTGVAAVILLFVWLWMKGRLKHQSERIPAGFAILIFLAVLFAANNLAGQTQKAVAAQEGVRLMTDASAAADRDITLKAGEMVTVTGKKDVWVEVEFRGDRYFVRENRLIRI